jgi:hypothetical protein
MSDLTPDPDAESEAPACEALAAAHERRAAALPTGKAADDLRAALIARAASLRGTASTIRREAPR